MGGAVGPFEEDVSVWIVAEDSFGAESTSLDVSREVAEGGFAAADGLELDVPLGFWAEGAVLIGGESRKGLRPTRFILEEVGVVGFEAALDEAAEAGGEGLVVDEEFFGVFGAMEGLVFGIEGNDLKSLDLKSHRFKKPDDLKRIFLAR